MLKPVHSYHFKYQLYKQYDDSVSQPQSFDLVRDSQTRTGIRPLCKWRIVTLYTCRAAYIYIYIYINMYIFIYIYTYKATQRFKKHKVQLWQRNILPPDLAVENIQFLIITLTLLLQEEYRTRMCLLRCVVVTFYVNFIQSYCTSWWKSPQKFRPM